MLLSDDSRSRMLAGAREFLNAADPAEVHPVLPDTRMAGTRVVVISLSREKAPALVGVGLEDTTDRSLRAAVKSVRSRAGAAEIQNSRIKIDAALQRSAEMSFGKGGKASLDPSLQGLWLPSAELLLLPEELSAQNLFNSNKEIQRGKVAEYVKAARGMEVEGDAAKPGSAYSALKFDSFMEGPAREVVTLYRGNPAPIPESASLLRACVAGGDYLVRHQHVEGLFDYLYQPATNELIADYNEVRHAGTAYALLELYAATKDPRYRAAGERAIEVMLRWIKAPEGKDFETIVYEGGKAKLGAAALAVIAILEHREVTGEAAWMDHAEKLARFLLFQQQRDGRFESNYFFGKRDEDPFESIYYPGEAILALTRMQAADPEHRFWSDAASRGVDWLMRVRDGSKKDSELTHDHWLLIAMNELYPVTQNKEHLAYAGRIAGAILQAQRTESAENPDWIGSFYDPPRSTPTATRAEALVAMWRLSGKAGLKRDLYLDALKKMAVFQMRCQITPENAMYLPRPDVALGGFRRSLEDWEVRIDYIQHSISSLLGLRNILQER